MKKQTMSSLAGLLLSLLAISVSGEEPKLPVLNTEAQKTTDSQKIDEELEQELLPEEAQETPAEVLDRTVNNMRDAGEQIEAGQAGKETVQKQQRVIDDLARLIELLQNQPPPPQPDQNNPPQQPNPDQKPQAPPKDQQEQDQQQKQQQQKEEEQAQRKPADGQDSQERQDKAKETQRRAAERAKLFKDIWGHLPEAVRNELRNNFSEEYLPKYAPEVRKYFEELAKRRRAEGTR